MPKSYRSYNNSPLFSGSWSEQYDRGCGFAGAFDRFNPQTPSLLEQSILIQTKINDLLSTVAAMNPGERHELRKLAGMPECSPFLWMPNGDGGWTPPIYEQDTYTDKDGLIMIKFRL